LHANAVGYATWNSKKFGYLSDWLGSMGGMTYAAGTRFHIVNVTTGQSAFSGTIEERGGADEYKTRVWQCDFSSFSTVGHYRLAVEGVGCSYPFEIHPDAYRTAFHGVARGLFHQRCGCAFLPQNTLWSMPRCHHSEDIPAFQSSATYVNDTPSSLANASTGQRINYWGGWHDAGDCDIYDAHLKIPFMLFAAYDLNPGSFADAELNIPESGNGIPDILDEARWGVDHWKRLQMNNGGVPSHSTPFPSPSCITNCTAIYASAASSGATHLYAGMAAAMGYYMNRFGKTAEATDYINSAKKSYAYSGSGSEKAMAALWLWRATGESSYHETYKSMNPGYSGGWDEAGTVQHFGVSVLHWIQETAGSGSSCHSSTTQPRFSSAVSRVNCVNKYLGGYNGYWLHSL